MAAAVMSGLLAVAGVAVVALAVDWLDLEHRVEGVLAIAAAACAGVAFVAGRVWRRRRPVQERDGSPIAPGTYNWWARRRFRRR